MLFRSILIFHILCIIPFGHSVQGQDTQFSQSFATPMYVNPALTGLIDGGFRIATVYRDQWQPVLDNPLKSYVFTGEIKFRMFEKAKNSADLLGVGLMFFADRVPVFDFNTNQLALFAAYHKSLGLSGKQYISAGFQFGIVQKNLNYEEVYFQDQFNGVDAYDLGTGENLPPNNFGYGDFGIGVHSSLSPISTVVIASGISYHHFHRPNISFYKDVVDFGAVPQSNKLFTRLQLYSSADIRFNESNSIIPRIIYSKQGPHQSLVLGSSYRFDFIKTEGTAVSLGALVRSVKDESSFALESLIVLMGIDLNGLKFGFSYDANLRSASSQTFKQSSFELSVSYIGSYSNEVNYCPRF